MIKKSFGQHREPSLLYFARTLYCTTKYFWKTLTEVVVHIFTLFWHLFVQIGQSFAGQLVLKYSEEFQNRRKFFSCVHKIIANFGEKLASPITLQNSDSEHLDLTNIYFTRNIFSKRIKYVGYACSNRQFLGVDFCKDY